jgi:hypothetical protein
MESLAEIMAHVERLAFAREQERSASPSALQLPSSLEQATLPLDFPLVELPPSPDYIQAEAFLEVSGYFQIPPDSYENAVAGCCHAGGRRPCLHGRLSGKISTF